MKVEDEAETFDYVMSLNSWYLSEHSRYKET